jgi:hypothetical protein
MNSSREHAIAAVRRGEGWHFHFGQNLAWRVNDAMALRLR